MLTDQVAPVAPDSSAVPVADQLVAVTTTDQVARVAPDHSAVPMAGQLVAVMQGWVRGQHVQGQGHWFSRPRPRPPKAKASDHKNTSSRQK